VFALVLARIGAIFGVALQRSTRVKDERRNLVCLARNVYFEARGEPVSGQYRWRRSTMTARLRPLRGRVLRPWSTRKLGSAPKGVWRPFHGRSSIRCRLRRGDWLPLEVAEAVY